MPDCEENLDVRNNDQQDIPKTIDVDGEEIIDRFADTQEVILRPIRDSIASLVNNGNRGST